jgi:hypothetical protein
MQFRHALGMLMTVAIALPAVADTKSDVRYYELMNELGVNVLTGAGVAVAQVEAYENTWNYTPNIASFPGKYFRFASGNSPASGHATSVGQSFYGTAGVANGITQITNFGADGWLGTTVLAVGFNVAPTLTPHNTNPYNPHTGQNTNSTFKSRIVNHSWIGNLTTNDSFDPRKNLDALLRSDYLTASEDYIQVAGMNNRPQGTPNSTSTTLMAQTFNAIAVGTLSGNHHSSTRGMHSNGVNNPWTVPGYGPYVAGRVRPDVVAPNASTSDATAFVSGAVALLVEAADDNPSFSLNRSRVNAAGQTIYQGATTEVTRAILMAGANRQAVTTSPNGYTYTPSSTNNLDPLFGAGLIDIYESYHILAGSQTDSAQDAGSVEYLDQYGWDYDNSFGGLAGSNNTADYYFYATQTGDDLLHATLAWNLDVNLTTLLAAVGPNSTYVDANLSAAGVLHNLNLTLYDITAGNTIVAQSISTINNSENIVADLIAGHQYRLAVSALGNPFNWDYGLAWRFAANSVGPLPPPPLVPSPASLALLLPGLALLMRRR